MASHARVLDPKTQCKLKLSKAKRLYAQGLIEWIEENVSFRKLTLAEIVARRSEIARQMEPLAFAELPGLIYQPSVSGTAATRTGYTLLAEANRFCIANG